MISYSRNIGKNFALDISGFRMIRTIRDGISFFDFDISWERCKYVDHNPSFDFTLIIFNLILIDFHIYYKYHRDYE